MLESYMHDVWLVLVRLSATQAVGWMNLLLQAESDNWKGGGGGGGGQLPPMPPPPPDPPLTHTHTSLNLLLPLDAHTPVH